MKTFKRHRTATEIIAQCADLGLAIETGPFERGSDHLAVKTAVADVMFNTVSGRFFGDILLDGVQTHFSSDVDRDEPWYQTLVNFFYTDEDPPK